MASPALLARVLDELLRGPLCQGDVKPAGRAVSSVEEDYRIAPSDGDDVPGMLGKGAFASVWRYRRVTPSSMELPESGTVAIKQLAKEAICQDPRSLGHTIAELRALSRLGGHGNILKLHEVLHTGQHLFIVAEHCDCGSLAEYTEDRWSNGVGVTEEETAIVLKQLCDALAYIHRRNFVHRDIKGENVLYRADAKRVTLIDFGLAKHCVDGPPGATPSSPDDVISPEQQFTPCQRGGSCRGIASAALGVSLLSVPSRSWRP
eukprot:TRINITY_DN1983_c0_g1_i1.p2 TRINITY_DN1983_c0_g1~~TRINITY_DN1983_c0_g1_i1.p2  ORF type:complete len:262 (+),score=47.01 TRINITY_DN1983_c0_g1_i1:40-825(+)